MEPMRYVLEPFQKYISVYVQTRGELFIECEVVNNFQNMANVWICSVIYIWNFRDHSKENSALAALIVWLKTHMHV